MAGLFPMPVKTWRDASYDAIRPTRPELSISGQTVVITGAGTSIGRETALAFAEAGAATVHILGRRVDKLEETKSVLNRDFPGVKVGIHVGSVSSEEDVRTAANAIGAWDIFISNAGFLSTPSSIANSDPKDWWEGFETNVRGPYLIAKYFPPLARPGARMTFSSTETITLPVPKTPDLSSYYVSKLALTKLVEYIAAENPKLQVLAFHPGSVGTDMNRKSGYTLLPLDDVNLPAHFAVWAVSKEAAPFDGRYISCNWDVTELLAIKSKFASGSLFQTVAVSGWPYEDMHQ